MPNKTIVAIIAIVILVSIAMLTHQDPWIMRVGLLAIASLGGLGIWRNGMPKP